MWKAIFFVYLAGTPVNWVTPADFYTETECIAYASFVQGMLSQTIEENNLSPNEGYVTDSWCSRTPIKEKKL